MKRYNIYLTEQQMVALKELSKQTGLSVSEHIRRALDVYMTDALRLLREFGKRAEDEQGPS